jgi:dynein heavy chain 2, cytosolic
MKPPARNYDAKYCVYCFVVVNVQDANFATQLELAVRFGKTLIIQEVDGVEPMLYPLLRGDLISQGY